MKATNVSVYLAKANVVVDFPNVNAQGAPATYADLQPLRDALRAIGFDVTKIDAQAALSRNDITAAKKVVDMFAANSFNFEKVLIADAIKNLATK